jgi:tRNA 2-thiocytidine biosynthesis protein TtcA
MRADADRAGSPGGESPREMSAYATQALKRRMGQAIHTHEMISDGDHVLVGVSGGKDSMSLLWLLRDRIRRVPKKYRLTAVHVDPGFGADSAGQMESFFRTNGFDYRLFRSDIGPRAHSAANRENPCFLCSRLRRKILFDLAQEMGCERIALGHHKDDVIETFFINIFYGASVSTMLPVQNFFGGKVKIVRPLYLVDEDRLRRHAKAMGWPAIDLGCPTAGSSKRQEVKDLLNRLYRSNRKIRGNIFHALQNVKPEYLPSLPALTYQNRKK